MEHWVLALLGAGVAPGLAFTIRSTIRAMVVWRRETRIQEATDAFRFAETKSEQDAAFRLLCTLLDRDKKLPEPSDRAQR